ncbi:MAG: hypothetical protein ABL931_15570, partial [Usitatibacteraceae bacterium]
FYRLNVLEISVPPLRERGHDVDLLARHFMDHFSAKLGKQISALDREFTDFIRVYPWPGNVRELQNLIERAAILADGETLVYADLADALIAGSIPAEHIDNLENPLSVEGYIKQIVLKFQNTLSEVELANMLGIGRKALWMRRRRWGMLRQGKPTHEPNGNDSDVAVPFRNG